MAANRPSVPELLAAVRDFLTREVATQEDRKRAYDMRVAVNLLELIERAVRDGPRLAQEEQARLRALLGRDGDLETLNRSLCERIRAGEAHHGDSALLAHIRATALGKLSIDNPRYWTYRAVKARESEAS